MDNGTFKKILDSEQNLHDHSNIAEMPYRRIYDEASLESFLNIWNWRVVSEALEMAQKGKLLTADGNRIFMARGGQAYFPKFSAKNRAKNKKLKPDWAGIKQSLGRPGQPPNILPGDTKLGSKWHSSDIEPGRVRQVGSHSRWLPAIRQIYTYCVMTDARYGYLITDQELLAVRISWFSDTGTKGTKGNAKLPARRLGILEYKAVPWSRDTTASQNSDPGLTINLALWWLHMMAAVGHQIQEYDKAIVEAQDRGSKTPSESDDQQSSNLQPSETSRSETPDVHPVRSAASLGQHGREASPIAAVTRRKRTRDEQPDLGKFYSGAKRRVNPARRRKV
ncbi:MAG: hypothetical protein Q9182_007425 [Xanthomendoza sp. 2 TL-2023]